MAPPVFATCPFFRVSALWRLSGGVQVVYGLPMGVQLFRIEFIGLFFRVLDIFAHGFKGGGEGKDDANGAEPQFANGPADSGNGHVSQFAEDVALFAGVHVKEYRPAFGGVTLAPSVGGSH